MHWILTVSDYFSLSGALRRSRYFLLPPFALNHSQGQLLRVERLLSGQIIALCITQTQAGLLIQANKRLSGPETEEVSRKVRRMLRLGENLSSFVKLARKDPALHTVTRQGAYILRGATLFEDALKILILTTSPKETGLSHATWLVDRLGDPLPSNPTRHAFPTPQQVLWGANLLEETLGATLGIQAIRIARTFLNHEEALKTLDQPELPAETVENELRQLLELNGYTLSLLMLALGRYDYIPTDSLACQRVSQEWHSGQPVEPTVVRAAFEKWHPWGGLAYWLWDWTQTTARGPWEGEFQNGDFAS